MKRRALAVGSDPVASAVANDALVRGNAVDAVVAGVLAAAGAHAAVLFGPVQLIVGGAGVGLRTIDGRVRQPGRGAPRPRGFLEADDIPPAARVGVPALPAALAAAHASFGKSSAASVYAPAIDLAKRAMPERARVLEALARRGPPALTQAAIADELIAAAGRVAGGLVTAEDLAEVRPATEPCALVELGEHRAGTVPWGAEAVRDVHAAPRPSGAVRVVAAADMRGALAIACYELPDDGLSIPALGIIAPFCAEPVRRGAPRVKPGEPRPAAAPIALVERRSGARAGGEKVQAADLALAMTESDDAERALGELLRAVAGGAPVELAAGALGRGRAAGVIAAPDGVTGIGAAD